MATVISKDVTMVDTNCYSCGMDFMVPQWLDQQARDKGRGWFCPSCGKTTVYSESKVDKLKKQLESERTRAQWLRDQLDASEKSLSAQKGVVTKLKKRASAGVCPCCNRQFQNVKLHMGRKHPDFVKEQGTKVEHYEKPKVDA